MSPRASTPPRPRPPRRRLSPKAFPYAAVIFDLDGTLADSVGDIAASMNFVLAVRGLPTHAVDRYRLWVGKGLDLLARRALPARQDALLPEILEEYRERYGEHLADTTRPYPGVPEMLDRLTALRCPMAVLSNKREDFTRRFMDVLFSRWCFAAVRGERPGVPRKPDPTVALEIAAELGVKPAEVAFVGDTLVDMRTAVAAGMVPVGAAWGMRGRRELEANGAKIVLDSPEDLAPEVPCQP